MIYLSVIDLQVLAAFEDMRDHGNHEIADRLELPPWAVRSSVQALRRQRLIIRGRRGWGEHVITGSGIRELNERRQLKIVREEAANG